VGPTRKGGTPAILAEAVVAPSQIRILENSGTVLEVLPRGLAGG